jgi:hypothetical protein
LGADGDDGDELMIMTVVFIMMKNFINDVDERNHVDE